MLCFGIFLIHEQRYLHKMPGLVLAAIYDCLKVKVAQSCPTLCDPMDYLVHGILQARILEVGSLSPGDLPNQGLNPGLLHCKWILYQLSLKGSPRTLEWVAYPFSRGSSRPRHPTGIFCTAGKFFTNWAISEALSLWVQVERGHPTLMVCLLMLSITLTFMLWHFKARMTLGEAETHPFIKTLPSWHFLKILPTFLT